MAGNKFTKKYTKKQKLGWKEWTAIVLSVPIAVYVYMNFFYKDTTPYGYDKYDESVHDYLMQSPNYSPAYTSGKMVVIYYHSRDKNNPYFGLFRKAIDDIQRISEINDLYSFATFFMMTNNRYFDGEQTKVLLKNEKALKKVCRSFCVVNPKKRAVYFWYQPRQRDLTVTADINGKEVLIDNLKALEFWGAELKH